MATKRKRGNSWTYILKRKGLLPKPLYLTFNDEAEGDDYVGRVERLLDAGIVPAEFQERANDPLDLDQAIDKYTTQTSVPDMDERLLITIGKRTGTARLSMIDYAWAEKYIKEQKQLRQLAPSTIKHHVGALSRMFNWLVRQNFLVANPFKLLPVGYATYSPADKAVLAAIDKEPRIDQERNRRPSAAEEKAIRKILAGESPEGVAALKLKQREQLELLFDLALETGMRLREMVTLTGDQVVLKDKTIYLDKTKNGDQRQVPLTSTIIKRLKKLPAKGQLFPWWDGLITQDSLRKVSAMLSVQFARIFARAGCADLTFHDLRHEATCRFYEKTKLSDVEIAKILGWRSLKMALRYANLRASNLAGKLW